MNIAVLASDEQWEELKNTINLQVCVRINSPIEASPETSAFVVLNEPDRSAVYQTGKIILVNSVSNTLRELKAPGNVFRFNGWNTFLSRKKWEVSGRSPETIIQVGAAMGKDMIVVEDEPGFISARIISMIINEAYFTLEQNISTRNEIDTAMKTGTNYPYGPFEWASLIGLKNIADLLKKLSVEDQRYASSNLLKQEAAYGLNIKH